MKTLIFVFVALVSLSFCSCESKVKNGQRTKRSITSELQTNSTGEVDRRYKSIKQKASQLNLDSLELGFDSVQLRIWFDYSLASDLHLFIFKKVSGVWSGERITYSTDSENYPGYEKVITHSSKHVDPMNGWDRFIDTLSAHNIFNLKNDKDIGGADGVSYIIEGATKNRYFYKRFWSPEYSKADPQSKDMINIIHAIEEEFNFERIQK